MANALDRAGRWLFNQPYVLLTLAVLFWAGNIVLARLIAGHVPPIAISVLRWAVAFFIILPVAWPHLSRDWPAIRRSLPVMTALALTGTAVPNVVAFVGLQYTQAINALLIQSTGPLLIALWTFGLFRDRLSLGQAAGIVLSLTGVVVIISDGSLEKLSSVSFNVGDILIVLSLLIFGFYSALTRKRPRVHWLSFLTFSVGWGTILLLPAYAWEISTGYTIKFDTLTIATLAYIAIFPSLLSYLFFNRGVEIIGPNRAAPFLHLNPVFGSALAILILSERPEWFHALGYFLVLCGVAVAARRHRTA